MKTVFLKKTATTTRAKIAINARNSLGLLGPAKK